MSAIDKWIISVDDHIIEPPHVWTSRIPAQYQGVCPQVRNENGTDVWVYDGRRVGVTGLVVQGGLGPENFDPSPQNYGDMRPACFDPKARLEAMDLDGVLASMPFPNFPRFCGQEFNEARDKDLGFLCIQAYNDYLVEEWAAVAPERMMTCGLIPLWDPTLAGREIERMAWLGMKSFAFSEHPPSLGLPSIHDSARYWDPVFAAAAETGLPISIHVGSSSTVPSTGPDSPRIIPSVLINWVAARTAVDWLFSDLFARFPDLRITLSEGGIGWVPLVLEQSERQIHHYGFMDRLEMSGSFLEGGLTVTKREQEVATWKHGDLSAVDVFRKHIRGCFIGGIHSASAAHAIRTLGADLFMAETDFPHADSSFPDSLAAIERVVGGFTPDQQQQLRRGNAIDWYRLDEVKLEEQAAQLQSR